jgi:hypothetical protein
MNIIILIYQELNAPIHTLFQSDQSGGLKDDCNKDVNYQCPAFNIPAQSKVNCSYCAKGEKVGTDYCAIGRDGIYLLSYILMFSEPLF